MTGLTHEQRGSWDAWTAAHPVDDTNGPFAGLIDLSGRPTRTVLLPADPWSDALDFTGRAFDFDGNSRLQSVLGGLGPSVAMTTTTGDALLCLPGSDLTVRYAGPPVRLRGDGPGRPARLV